jgi:penicillin amidase
VSGVTPVRKAIKRGAAVLGLLLLLALVAGGAGALWLRGRLLDSLPQLDGEVTLAGLSDAVRVERDALGIPTIVARDRLDLARATGFVHAQDRFFEMDLLRRQAAGELSELFGSAALETDRSHRVHRFRAVAERNLVRLDAGRRALLEAYRDGVNAGLRSLGDVPPEYVALRLQPAPWRSADSLLVVLAMYLDLQSDAAPRESALGLMYDTLPAELVDFLTPAGTGWDAPLLGPALAGPPIPGAAVFDLRREAVEVEQAHRSTHSTVAPERDPALEVPGSNNWAVDGAHSTHGGALLANDMHLGLGLPAIWYRAAFVVEPEPGAGDPLRIDGVTLPGVPLMVVGSNGSVAWGFTNSQGDWSDLIIVEPAGDDGESYRTADGPRTYERFEETIHVRGSDDVPLTVRWTEWGPLLDEDHSGRPRALRWVAHLEGGTDLGMVGLEAAEDVEAALEVARHSGIPAQNFVVADRHGRIAWSLIGRIPRRRGHDGRVPSSWAEGDRGWDGWLEPAEYPQVVDPAVGRIWTANNRVGDVEASRRIGDGGFALGARAGQIRDALLELPQTDERAMLELQLDDRARFLTRWRELLLELLAADAERDPRRAELRRLVERDWNGHAAIDSTGYRLVRGFRSFLARDVLQPLTAACSERDERFDPLTFLQIEGPLWKLVSERPPHLLDPRFESWEALMLATADRLLDYYEGLGTTLADRTWGERNTLQLSHPFALAVPRLARWLDAPPRPLPGDAFMPRVQSPRFGASVRMVVSPGREEAGILHIPGGQSGHPWSPWYLEGLDDWAAGNPTPLRPGPTLHTLTLLPAA